jgi:hypothetical protein
MAIAFLVTLAGAEVAKAQIPISEPYIAVYGGQARTNFAQGPNSKDLDWRNSWAVEVGFKLFGLSVSPGYTKVGRATWSNQAGTATVEMDFDAVYLNLGAREEMGLYFAGGLNWTFWNALPPNLLDLTQRAEPEIGFQAYLGFTVGLENLPVKFMFEAGYAHYGGNIGTNTTDLGLREISSTGPVARAGIALAW